MCFWVAGSLCLRDLVARARPLSLVVSGLGSRSMATVPLGLGSRGMVIVRRGSVSWRPEHWHCPGEAGIRVSETWLGMITIPGGIPELGTPAKLLSLGDSGT